MGAGTRVPASNNNPGSCLDVITELLRDLPHAKDVTVPTPEVTFFSILPALFFSC